MSLYMSILARSYITDLESLVMGTCHRKKLYLLAKSKKLKCRQKVVPVCLNDMIQNCIIELNYN